MEFSEKIVNDHRSSIIDVSQLSKYASGSINHLNSRFSQDEENSASLSFLGD